MNFLEVGKVKNYFWNINIFEKFQKLMIA